MEKIVSYLEKLGYIVEEQGRIEKYLVVFKGKQPIGFILPDLTVKLVSGYESQDNIQAVVDFLNDNQGLESVGASELLLAGYRGSQLTTYFDVKSMLPLFVCYIRNLDTGEVITSTHRDADTAILAFVTQAHMIDLSKFTASKETFGDRIRGRLLNYLLAQKNEKAGQR